MHLNLVPLLAILVINLVVAIFVMRQKDSRAGFFLILNALSLIVWAGGQTLYGLLERATPEVLALPYLAALIVPGNLLYFALTRPYPLREGMKPALLIAAIFGPALALAILENYQSGIEPFFDYSYRLNEISLSSITRRATVLYLTITLGTSIAILAARYYTSTGPEQNLFKHLLAAIVGPLFFAGVFWLSSRSTGPAVIPSPSFIIAVIAQAGLIVVLRQQETQDPRTLSRAIYYLTAILVAFVAINLFSEFYEFVQGRFVMDRTAGWMMLGATLLLLLLARLGFIERAFDRWFFARAADYRKVVEETRQDLREARERLRKAERLSVVGEVAARVAHEIKNPLGPIRGYTQMMKEKVEDDPDFRHREAFLSYIEVIAEEVDNIDRRVREFLQSARTPRLMIEEIDLNDMVDRCARVMRLELSAGREMADEVLPIRIDSNTDPKLEPIRADRGRIEEALFNLARNALEALGDQTRGRISIEAARAQNNDGEDGAQIVVSDNGPGFPMEEMEKYFEPFFTQKSGGTGLGLAIVKSTVEAHGGTIELRNRETGGSEVRIWLPKVAVERPGALLPRPV